jgi:hypothetical protein
MKTPTPKTVHVVMPRPDATPDQLRQLAAAKEMVERFLEEGDFDPDHEVSVSMAAHFAHEFLWTQAGGPAARWVDFPVETYFLELVPSTGVIPPHLAAKLLDETCSLFCWLAASGRISQPDADALCIRAEACREQMLAETHGRFSPELMQDLASRYEEDAASFGNRATRRRNASLRRRARSQLN